MGVSAFLFPGGPRRIIEVIQGLSDAGFLQALPSSDSAQLENAPDHKLTNLLKRSPRPKLAELDEILSKAEPGTGPIHLYAQLTAPKSLKSPTREAAEEVLGELLGPTDPRAPFDPLEVIFPFELNDLSGAYRAKEFARSTVIDAPRLEGQVKLLRPSKDVAFEVSSLAELRVMNQCVPYMAFALSKAVKGPVYLAALED